MSLHLQHQQQQAAHLRHQQTQAHIQDRAPEAELLRLSRKPQPKANHKPNQRQRQRPKQRPRQRQQLLSQRLVQLSQMPVALVAAAATVPQATAVALQIDLWLVLVQKIAARKPHSYSVIFLCAKIFAGLHPLNVLPQSKFKSDSKISLVRLPVFVSAHLSASLGYASLTSASPDTLISGICDCDCPRICQRTCDF